MYFLKKKQTFATQRQTTESSCKNTVINILNKQLTTAEYRILAKGWIFEICPKNIPEFDIIRQERILPENCLDTKEMNRINIVKDKVIYPKLNLKQFNH